LWVFTEYPPTNKSEFFVEINNHAKTPKTKKTIQEQGKEKGDMEVTILLFN